jgi:hypothetical protein
MCVFLFVKSVAKPFEKLVLMLLEVKSLPDSKNNDALWLVNLTV